MGQHRRQHLAARWDPALPFTSSILALLAVPLQDCVPRDETSRASAVTGTSEPATRGATHSSTLDINQRVSLQCAANWRFSAGKKQASPDPCHCSCQPLGIPGWAGVSEWFVINPLSPKFMGPSGHPTNKYNPLYDDTKSEK